MITQGTPIRAVVPYRPPSNGAVSTIRVLLRRFSSGLDKLFSTRRRLYFFGITLLSFGVLIGGYYTSVSGVESDLNSLLSQFDFLIPFIFFSGLTVFGVICVPVCLLFVSFRFGCSAHLAMFSSAQGILCFVILLLFFMSLLLFLTEAFNSSLRAFAGWKTLFGCKSFGAFAVLFVSSFLLSELAVYMLSSL